MGGGSAYGVGMVLLSGLEGSKAVVKAGSGRQPKWMSTRPLVHQHVYFWFRSRQQGSCLFSEMSCGICGELLTYLVLPYFK